MSGGDGRGADLGHDDVVDKGGEFDGGGEPAREVGFEGVVVCVAGFGAFACDFGHDVVDEEDVGGFEDAEDAGLPEGIAVCLWGRREGLVKGLGGLQGSGSREEQRRDG